MCTIGALRIKDDEFLLFKNKDFAQSRFSDRVVLDAGLHRELAYVDLG